MVCRYGRKKKFELVCKAQGALLESVLNQFFDIFHVWFSDEEVRGSAVRREYFFLIVTGIVFGNIYCFCVLSQFSRNVRLHLGSLLCRPNQFQGCGSTEANSHRRCRIFVLSLPSSKRSIRIRMRSLQARLANPIHSTSPHSPSS